MASPFYILGLPVSIDLEGVGDQAIIENLTQDGPTADVTMRCYWADRFTVYKGLVGGAYKSGTQVKYAWPFTYPDSPNLRCVGISNVRGIKPRTNASGWVYYAQCRFVAHFAVPSWDAIPQNQGAPDPSFQEMTTTRMRGTSEIFAPPGGSLVFADGSPVPDSSIGIVRGRTEIVMTRHLVPWPPINAIMSLTGCVNNDTITFGDQTFARGFLLYTNPDIEPVSDPSTGNRCWDITFTMLGNQDYEWNKFLSPAGTWQIAGPSVGTTVFQYQNFSPVIFGASF